MNKHFLFEIGPIAPGAAVGPTGPPGMAPGLHLEESGVSAHFWLRGEGMLESHTYSCPERKLFFALDGYVLSDSGEEGFFPALADRFCRIGRRFDDTFPGAYNLIVADLERLCLHVYNDDAGILPCYFHLREGRVLLTNSLFLMKTMARTEADPLAIAQEYSLGWTLGSKTLFREVSRIRPGSRYVFALGESSSVRSTRISRSWRYADPRGRRELQPLLEEAWGAAIERGLRHFSPPYGVMLSGGLDSRMVLAEIAAQRGGDSVIACTHGDAESREFDIARRVASIASVRFVPNPVDDSYRFTDLQIQAVFEITDSVFNPVWFSSARRLVDSGVELVATGSFGDSLLGGSNYFSYDAHRKRFVRNLLLAWGLPMLGGGSYEETIESVGEFNYRRAEKRLKHYAFLLKPEYREVCRGGLARLKSEIEKELHTYLESATLAPPQLQARFIFEMVDRRRMLAQDLIVRGSAELFLPVANRDFLQLVTNMDPNLAYDHNIYLGIVKHRYPRLARLEVQNLFGSAARPRTLIELDRALHLVARRYARKPEKRGWVNFDEWLRGGNRLEEYRAKFLELDAVFDPANVNAYFDAVRNRTRRLYDGNETLNFLRLGMLLV